MLRVREAAFELYNYCNESMLHEDYRPLLGMFSGFKDHKLDFDGEAYTLFTKPAFVEYDDGKVEEGIAYLLSGHQLVMVFVSEICFARFKTAWEVFDMLAKARDCKDFWYVINGRVFASDGLNNSLLELDIKTHQGVKHCIYYYDELVADDAVFFYGGNLFDGWSGFIDNDGCSDCDWHVFRGSEWVIRKDLGVVGVDRKDYDAGMYDKTLGNWCVNIIEDYDDTNEIHRIARALPFRRRECVDDYRYNEELGYDERIHPQTVLLPANE